MEDTLANITLEKVRDYPYLYRVYVEYWRSEGDIAKAEAIQKQIDEFQKQLPVKPDLLPPWKELDEAMVKAFARHTLKLHQDGHVQEAQDMEEQYARYSLNAPNDLEALAHDMLPKRYTDKNYVSTKELRLKTHAEIDALKEKLSTSGDLPVNTTATPKKVVLSNRFYHHKLLKRFIEADKWRGTQHD